MTRRGSRSRTLAVALLLAGVVAPAAAQRRPAIPMDSSLARWIERNGRALPSMDAPYSDSAWAWVGTVVARASLLALGENIHGGHEPLAFRNHVVRYAVTRLGFDAVAIESGFTEGETVDRFIQGEGDTSAVDSVLDAGISYGFSRLPENRELVLWLRAHNASARRKVHFYGIDQSGVGEFDMGGPAAIEGALAFLRAVSPDAEARHRRALTPFLSRFTVGEYPKLNPQEKTSLQAALSALERTLVRDSSRLARATSVRAHAMAVRNAWAARRLEQAFIVSGREGARAMATIRLRDSVMAENTKWALRQSGAGGRLVVFAHNGHSLAIPLTFPAMGLPMVMMGERLRADFGDRMRSIGTWSDAFVGLGEVLKDMSSFEAAMAGARGGNWYIDLRTADREPRVVPLLRTPWVTRIHAWLQPFVPRTAMDVVAVLDTVRATRMRGAR